MTGNSQRLQKQARKKKRAKDGCPGPGTKGGRHAKNSMTQLSLAWRRVGKHHNGRKDRWEEKGTNHGQSNVMGKTKSASWWKISRNEIYRHGTWWWWLESLENRYTLPSLYHSKFSIIPSSLNNSLLLLFSSRSYDVKTEHVQLQWCLIWRHSQQNYGLTIKQTASRTYTKNLNAKITLILC